MKTALTVITLLAIAFLATPCLAQTKIAVVDTKEVIKTSVAGVLATKALEDKFADRKNQLGALQQEVAKLQEEVKPLGEKSPKYQELQTKFNKFREEELKFRQDANQAQIEIFKPLSDKFNKILADYAKENGIKGVQDRSTYVYVDPSLDITEDIIKRMNQAQ